MKILGIVALVYFACFISLIAWDKKADLDGNSAYSFPVHGGDSPGYVRLAKNLIKHRTFSSQPDEPFTPDTFRTPGYPLFLAAIHFLFGNYYAASILQMFLVFVTAYLILKMGSKIASLFFLLNPATIFHSMIIMSDTFFVFWIVLSAYLLFFAEGRNKFSWIFGSGIALSAAVLVRPIAQLLPFVFVLFFVWMRWKRANLKKIGLGLMVFVLGYLAFVEPWMIRNKKVSGVWGISAAGPCLAVRFHLPMFFSTKQNVNFFAIPPDLYPKSGLEDMDCVLKNAPAEKKLFFEYFKRYSIEYILFHLTSAIPVILASNFKNFIYDLAPLEKKINQWGWIGKRGGYFVTHLITSGRSQEVFQFYTYKLGWLFLLEYLGWGLILLLAIRALFPLKKETLFLFAMIAYLAILNAPATAPRYRLPLEPFLFLLAASGWKKLRKIVG